MSLLHNYKVISFDTYFWEYLGNWKKKLYGKDVGDMKS